MMYKKTKGFSLAELLISLLIISIVLAAAIPTITKRRAMSPENVWNWSNKNNVAFFGVGHNQSAVIGYDMMPFSDVSDADKINKYYDTDSLNADTSDFRFTTDGDKLVLVRRYITEQNKSENMKNSHISFYNAEDRTGATSRDLIYAGRISSDQHNLAFGIASLQSVDWVDTANTSVDNDKGRGRGYNTALGHYTLSFLKGGAYNTALGESALTLNFDGHRNTGVGAYALNTVAGSDNTALGANAGKYIDVKATSTSIENTLIGANTMSVGVHDEDVQGSGNTALGATACGSITGNDNICIGRNTGVRKNADNVTLDPIQDNYGLYIGHDPNGAPLLHGHSSHSTSDKGYNIINNTSSNGFDKELDVNARYFRVKTFDSGRTMFEIAADAGTDGYSPAYGRFARMNLALKDIMGKGSIQMAIDGPEATQTENLVNMYFYDPFEGNKTKEDCRTLLPVIVNRMMKIHAVPSTSTTVSDKVSIITNPALEINGSVKIARNVTGAGFGINENKIFVDISGASNAQVLQVLDKSQNPIIKVEKENSNIYFSPTNMYFSPKEFHISNTTEKLAISAQRIDLNPNGGNVYVTGEINIDGTLVKNKIKNHDQRIQNLESMASDARLKNISGDSIAGLKEINALEVKNYTYKNDENKNPHVGVIAQQLQKVFPNSVIKGEDGYLRIKTEEIFYAMVNSIKELFAQIQDLTAKIVGLDKRITELEKENAILKNQNAEFEKRLSKLEAKIEK